MKSETIIEILEAHTDSLGHLNHVQAVEYMERARDDWYRMCGLWEGDEKEELLGTVVVNIDFNYRGECFLGERLVVLTWPERVGTKSFRLGHQIIRPDGEVAIGGHATSVVMDMRDRRTIPVPECMARHFPAGD